MGADGHFYVMKKSVWDENYPDVKPEEIGATVMDIIGVTCVTGYSDTNDIDYADDSWGQVKGFSLYRERQNYEHKLKTIEEKGTNGVYKTPYFNWNKSDLEEKLSKVLEHSKDEFDHSQRCDSAYWFFDREAQNITVWT